MTLTPHELDITHELVSIALANAADAFAKMTSQKTLITEYQLHRTPPRDWPMLPDEKNDEPLYVLTTDVKGEITGASYLIFNQRDVASLLSGLSPERVRQSVDGLDEYQQAVLLETDNIVSAAMITQLSNFLERFIYGDVPRLTQRTKEELTSDLARHRYPETLYVYARFRAYQTRMTPVFVCFFNREILAAIRQLIHTHKHVSLLKKRTTSLGRLE